MSDTAMPDTSNANFLPERTHCEHCLTGEGDHFERWNWSLMLFGEGGAVELARDGHIKLTVPLTADQVTQLMGEPTTLGGVLEGGL